MRYLMKQALLSFGDDFSVTDEKGKEHFYFDGKVGTIGKKIEIKDPNKEIVAIIRQKFFTQSPTYTVKQGRDVVATIYKKLFTFRPTFVIDAPGADRITITGRLLEHDYKFVRKEKEIATCSKKWFRARDTYGIELHDSGDSLLVLSAAVVIDLVLHPLRDSTL